MHQTQTCLRHSAREYTTRHGVHCRQPLRASVPQRLPVPYTGIRSHLRPQPRRPPSPSLHPRLELGVPDRLGFWCTLRSGRPLSSRITVRPRAFLSVSASSPIARLCRRSENHSTFRAGAPSGQPTAVLCGSTFGPMRGICYSWQHTLAYCQSVATMTYASHGSKGGSAKHSRGLSATHHEPTRP